MTYKHGDWTLYQMDVDFNVIGRRKSYFFSKRTPKKGTPCDMPDGYEVGTNKRTELPFLRFSGGKVSVWKKRQQAKGK